jgi:hypothetical protein
VSLRAAGSVSEAAKPEGHVVQLEGMRSWRFRASAGDQLPHVALFVREAVGLSVAAGPAVPPRLAGSVPDRRDLLDEDERQIAGHQWTSWWEAVLGVDADAQEASPTDLTGLADLRTRHEQAGSPPDYSALVDRPALRRAVVETFLEAHRWVDSERLGLRGQREAPFPHRLVAQVAEGVAFDRSVDIGDIHGSAVLLHVEGSWWHLFAPGTVVCSIGAAAQPDEAESILRRAFESGLQR